MSAKKRTTAKTATAKKTTAKKIARGAKRPVRKKKRTPAKAFLPMGPAPRAVGQSGDLQGLSRLEGPDSESVEELMEEGNAFEAGVVTGVEAAEKASQKEVRTQEVP